MTAERRHPVAVLLKRVDLRPAVDPLTGSVTHDPHGGLSAADRSALELALRLAERDGSEVLAVSAGGPEADGVLRTALEAGASRAVRVDCSAELPSATVAAALAGAVRAAAWVCCGDYSLDRGSGSVPAFVAGELGAAQALGLAAVHVPPSGPLAVERRLDAGRREVLAVAPPAVVSVESGVAALRRPPLPAALASRSATVEVVAGPPHSGRSEAPSRPYRPRPRVLAGPDPDLPARDRLVALSGALVQRHPPRVVRAGPEEAADELLAFLVVRGYLDGSAVSPPPTATNGGPAEKTV